MVELVEYIAKSLARHPEFVKVTSTEDENGDISLKLSVLESDMGKLIGKQGKIAKAIRTILKAISLKDNIKINLEIKEIKQWGIKCIL